MDHIRARIKQEQAQKYRNERRKLRQLWEDGGWEAVAEALDRRCPWCLRLLEPTISEGLNGDLLFVWPDYCGCAQEQANLALEKREAEQAAREWERLRWAEALNRSGMVGWLASATFESYEPREDWVGANVCKAGVMDYANALFGDAVNGKPWLILHGSYGTGKSHLAAAVIHEALRKGRRQCYFRVWPQYLKRLQKSWNHREGDEVTSDIVEELQQGTIIVIDDLDKKQPSRSGWAEDELFAVLNYRYNRALPTILTFNHSPDDPYVTPDGQTTSATALEAYLGRATLDRISQLAFDVIQFQGPSYRSSIEWKGV